MWIVRCPAPGHVHHVIARIIDREFVITDDIARQQYLRLLSNAMSSSDWQCLAYAIMSNHIHLAMLAGQTPAERWMRRVHPPYIGWLNRRLDRFGPLFAGSPEMWAVHPDREAALLAYIHNNPVRAGVVAHAQESTWTSHRDYIGGRDLAWLRADVGLQRAGLTSDTFDKFVDSLRGARLERPEQESKRRSARLRGAFEIGTPVDATPPVTPLLRRRFAYLRPEPARIVEVAAEVTGIQLQRMAGKRRDSAAVLARTVAVHSGRALGVSITAITAIFGVSPSEGSRLGLRPLDEAGAAAAKVVVDRIEGEVAAFIAAEATAVFGKGS